jgi:hypothetical protein
MSQCESNDAFTNLHLTPEYDELVYLRYWNTSFSISDISKYDIYIDIRE